MMALVAAQKVGKAPPAVTKAGPPTLENCRRGKTPLPPHETVAAPAMAVEARMPRGQGNEKMEAPVVT